MGFTNETEGRANGRFANFKKGRIVTKLDGKKQDFAAIEGAIMEIWCEDAEYNNEPYNKIVVRIYHEEGETLLGFPINSGYGNAFCRILPNIDPTKDVKIAGSYTQDERDPERGYSGMFISQDGKALKWFYTKDNAEGKKVPPIKEQKVGKKMVKDYSDREAFFEHLIIAFNKKLEKIHGKPEKKEKEKPKHVDADSVNEPIDGLPF